jgi:hypothetical protein
LLSRGSRRGLCYRERHEVLWGRPNGGRDACTTTPECVPGFWDPFGTHFASLQVLVLSSLSGGSGTVRAMPSGCSGSAGSDAIGNHRRGRELWNRSLAFSALAERMKRSPLLLPGVARTAIAFRSTGGFPVALKFLAQYSCSNRIGSRHLCRSLRAGRKDLLLGVPYLLRNHRGNLGQRSLVELTTSRRSRRCRMRPGRPPYFKDRCHERCRPPALLPAGRRL